MPEFSGKECRMFEALGMAEVLKFAKSGIMPISQLYQATSIHCFLEKLEGPAVDSLRRCFDGFKDGKLHRLTPEWDALIRLEDCEYCVQEIPYLDYLGKWAHTGGVYCKTPELNCTCHLGSVCGEACKQGKHHVGCGKEFHKR